MKGKQSRILAYKSSILTAWFLLKERRRCGLDLSAVSTKSSISKQLLKAYEFGRVQVPVCHLAKLAKIYDTSGVDFLKFINEFPVLVADKYSIRFALITISHWIRLKLELLVAHCFERHFNASR